MALVEPYELDGVSIGTSETSVVTGSAFSSGAGSSVNGVFELWVDFVQVGTMTKGDYFSVKVYEAARSAGTQRLVFEGSIGNAQVEPWIFPPMMLKSNWDMTIKKIAGTDRAVDAVIRGNTITIEEPYTLSAVTVGATELSIPNGGTTLQTLTTAGQYQLFVDGVANMAKADEYTVRIYEKVEGTGGTKRQIFKASLMDVQTSMFVSPVFHLRNGWDMTIQKISGTDRAFDASIRRVT
jgi:hypothetical protein